MWKKTTQPTSANIRKRISVAQEAIDAAIDLMKKNDRLWPSDTKGKHYAGPLLNAYEWLVLAQRRLTSR